MKCLRAILRITRSDRLHNIMIRNKLNMSETIEDIVLKKRLRWFGDASTTCCQEYVNTKNQKVKGR